MEWLSQGIWQDQNMPAVETLKSSLYGTYHTTVDLTEAFEKLGDIQEGRLYWETNDKKSVDAEYSLDGETFIKVPDSGFLPAIPEELHIRLHLRLGLWDIVPETGTEVYALILSLSNRETLKWEIDLIDRLIWGD